jgi:hypothetical protein
LTTPRRRSYVPADVLDAIEELIDKGRSPKQIEDELSKNGKIADRLPTLRTIQRIVAEKLKSDDTETWELGPVDQRDIDGAVVLDVLAFVVRATGGRTASLTENEARWITALHRVRPTIHGWVLYRLARLYISTRSRKLSTAPIDAFLAYKPWDDAWKHQTYVADVLFRLIPPAPFFLANSYYRFPPFPPFTVCSDETGWCAVIDYSPDPNDNDGHWIPMEGAFIPLLDEQSANPLLRELHQWGRIHAADRPPTLITPEPMSAETAYALGFESSTWRHYVPGDNSGAYDANVLPEEAPDDPQA